MLIIGRKKPRKGNEFGGVVLLYELFLQYLEDHDVKYGDIDLNWRNYGSRTIFLIRVYYLIMREITSGRYNRVSFHGTATDFTYYAPLIVFLCRITKKRITLRKFGGDFDIYYQKLSWIKKVPVRYALKNADCLFFETKKLVSGFRKLNKKSHWFPNTRKRPDVVKSDPYRKKFIFLGHVKAEKGVAELIKASNVLDSEYQIDIYGPLVDTCLKSEMDKSQASYKGIIQPEKVQEKLVEYDVLVLPSYREGYPGVIIEALSVGIPVIATGLPGIKEIIEDGKNGFLVEPENYLSIVEAILKFNDNVYSVMKEKSMKSFENFEQDRVMERIIEYL